MIYIYWVYIACDFGCCPVSNFCTKQVYHSDVTHCLPVGFAFKDHFAVSYPVFFGFYRSVYKVLCFDTNKKMYSHINNSLNLVESISYLIINFSFECVTVLATQVKLQGGRGPFEGTVEVYHSGQWGEICPTEFDMDDAKVICKMLGYTR